MVHNMKKMLCFFFICICAFLSVPDSGLAVSEQNHTVRVAYPMQKGLTDVDEYGKYSGYTYEYLEEVAQYTGWDFEFVQVPGDINESLTKLMEMLKNGEVDLMGGMLYNEKMAAQFDYATHSYGVAETVLQVPYDSTQYDMINSQVQQNVRVAVIKDAKQRRQELEDYFSMNMVTPEYVECTDMEGQIAAVREGRADMMLNTNMNYAEGMRTIARFSPKPFYFITTKGSNIKMMEELNGAIMSIEQANPYFTTTLYEKYFTASNEKLLLSESEKEYVKWAGNLRVGMLSNSPPYQYRDAETEEPRGVSADFLRYIAEKSGLHFEFTVVDTQEELDELIRTRKVDLVAGIPYNYNQAREKNLSMSQPYVSSQYLLLMNEQHDEKNIVGKWLAVIASSNYEGEYKGKLKYYDTAEACIEAVDDGEADYTYIDAYTAQYYINMPRYRNLKLIPQTYEPRKVCFGVVKPISHELLSILNKSVATIPETDIQGMINQNLIREQNFSLKDYIQEKPVESVVIIVCIFLFVIAILAFFLMQREKMNKRNALELKKHFRVYALVNEYFFEYDFQTRKMQVFSPAAVGGKVEQIEYEQDTARLSDTDEEQRKLFWDLITSRRDGIKEVKLCVENGVTHWLRIALETVYDGEKPAYALGKINIIDDEKREKDALLERSQLDSLTHIYNAQTSHDLICGALQNMKPMSQGALILLDIDYFKSINDTYGHLKGDETLIKTAAMLRLCFGKDDIVGRPGGDEFIVYMGSADPERLEKKCTQICEKARAIKVQDDKHITISVGAVNAVQGDSYSALYQRADKALYKVKAAGRDRYEIAQ